MTNQKKRPELTLSDKERRRLQEIAKSQKAPFREVRRARILLEYANETPIMQISTKLNVARRTVHNCIDKALAVGAEAALQDRSHGRFKEKITPEAKLWVVNTACKKPKELGRPEEVWTFSLLAKYTREHAAKAGHECLENANKSTIWRILDEHPIRPHKIRYYLERRDEHFEEKMNNVLAVYQEVNLSNKYHTGKRHTVTLSMDEKPGVQAIKNLAPDLPPVPGKYPQIARDHQYKRLGTQSIIAAIDLHDGHIFVEVHDHHRSEEFIMLLDQLNRYYPDYCRIRVILDNLQVHTSAETMAYLATKPNRFVFVFTPKHGSWLNLIETLFSKMVRTVLKNIRVDSKEELRQRILVYINLLNKEPIVFHWKKWNIRIRS